MVAREGNTGTHIRHYQRQLDPQYNCLSRNKYQRMTRMTQHGRRQIRLVLGDSLHPPTVKRQSRGGARPRSPPPQSHARSSESLRSARRPHRGPVAVERGVEGVGLGCKLASLSRAGTAAGTTFSWSQATCRSPEVRGVFCERPMSLLVTPFPISLVVWWPTACWRADYSSPSPSLPPPSLLPSIPRLLPHLPIVSSGATPERVLALAQRRIRPATNKHSLVYLLPK